MQYCLSPGCSTLVPKGRCATHARQADQGTRGSAQQRGYTSRWATYSQQFRRQHPFCGERHDGGRDAQYSRCVQQGLDTPAECVDHTIPSSPDHPLFWDATNHMSACLACNTWKSSTLEKHMAKAPRPNPPMPPKTPHDHLGNVMPGKWPGQGQ